MPAPEYPQLTELAEASCEASFIVGEDGAATDIRVDCDDPRFSDPTLEGLSKVRYKTRESCGRVCPQVGERVEYPIEYRLED